MLMPPQYTRIRSLREFKLYWYISPVSGMQAHGKAVDTGVATALSRESGDWDPGFDDLDVWPSHAES